MYYDDLAHALLTRTEAADLAQQALLDLGHWEPFEMARVVYQGPDQFYPYFHWRVYYSYPFRKKYEGKVPPKVILDDQNLVAKHVHIKGKKYELSYCATTHQHTHPTLVQVQRYTNVPPPPLSPISQPLSKVLIRQLVIDSLARRKEPYDYLSEVSGIAFQLNHSIDLGHRTGSIRDTFRVTYGENLEFYDACTVALDAYTGEILYDMGLFSNWAL